MSKDKYPRIFLKSNVGYCVYYPSNIFRNMRDLFMNSLIFGVFWYSFIDQQVHNSLLMSLRQTVLPS